MKNTITKGVILILTLSVLIAGIVIVYNTVTAPARKGADRVLASLEKLGAKIKNSAFEADQGVIQFTIPEDAAICEISTIKRKFDVTYTYKTEWWWSKKKLTVKRSYEGKAGIKQDNDTSIKLVFSKQADGDINVQGVKGEILSCSPTGDVEVLHDEDGVWNKLNKEDMRIAINRLDAEARKTLEETDIIKKSEENFIELIKKTTKEESVPILPPLG